MLAKIANDNARNREKRDALAFFASKLAPTGCELDGSLNNYKIGEEPWLKQKY